MVRCCAVQTLRVLHASTYEPCSVRERHPYRTHRLFRRRRHDRDQHLDRHQDEQSRLELHLERRLELHRLDEQSLHRQDEAHPRNHPDARHRRHQERRLGDLDHLGDQRHQQDVVRLGDPCPVMERKDCCQGG